MSKRTKHFYDFGPFRIDVEQRVLLREGEPVAMPPKAFDTLFALVSNHGRLLEKDDLIKTLWPETFVEEGNLGHQVFQVRKVLGDASNGQPYVETVPKRGYRFAAGVTESWDGEPAGPRLAAAGPTGQPAAPPSRNRPNYWHAGAAAIIISLLVGAAIGSRFFHPAGDIPLRKFSLSPPVALRINAFELDPGIGVSPNGKLVVFTAEADRRLWIYDLERGTSRPLEGTAGADDPFWSPDSNFVGYFEGSQVKKVSARGGTPIRVCQRVLSPAFAGQVDVRLRGGTWSPDGNSIVFSEAGKLYEVPAQGGSPRLLVSLKQAEHSPESAKPPTGLIRYPRFLPSKTGARVLAYMLVSDTKQTMIVHDLESGRRVPLGRGVLPFYSPSGHLLYQAGPRTYDLWALPFSLDTLRPTGEAFPIVRNGRNPAVSADGTLTYLDVSSLENWQLVWRDRMGNNLGTIGEPHTGSITHPSLSPDERRVVVEAKENGNWDIWVHDVDRPVKTRLTTHEATDALPNWSPKGDRIAFASGRTGDGDIYVVEADGSEKPILLGEPSRFRDGPTDWSVDENTVIFMRINMQQIDEMICYLKQKENRGGYEEVPFLENAGLAKLSPDGRYIAYHSGHSGRNEIYIRSFPDGKDQRRVSVNGGTQARWRRDGKELFYVEGDMLVAAPVSIDPTLVVGAPQPLFSSDWLSFETGRRLTYDVAADGQKFVLREPSPHGGGPKIRVVQNWHAEFQRNDRVQQQPVARY